MLEVNKIYHGDCLNVLKTFPDNSIDSCVTDPPYGISFMNKHWDYQIPSVEIWEQVLRVLKPGGHLLCACGTRTQHRMVCNIEDAGFEIRDVISWIYGSGFPKSLDISKAIDKAAGVEREVIGKSNLHAGQAYKTDKGWNDNNLKPCEDVIITAPATPAAKQWKGWGTALKPATEFWTLARKPISENTIAKNVLKHGTGGINIDGSRIAHNEECKMMKAQTNDEVMTGGGKYQQAGRREDVLELKPEGRFPANVIFGKVIDTIFILDEQISVDLQELIKSYYGEIYLSRVWDCLRNISEQTEGWQTEILQQEMLPQIPFKEDEGGGTSDVWQGSQQGINREDEAVQEAEGEGLPSIQGQLYVEWLQIHTHSGTVGRGVDNGKKDDDEKKSINSRTQIDNGNEIGAATKNIRTRSPQERNKERQQAEKFGSIGQLDTQENSQRYTERIEAIKKAKRGFIVFNSDLPEVFKKYFISTGLETEHFNSPGKILDEQSIENGIHSAGVGRNKMVQSDYKASSYDLSGERQMNRYEDGENIGASRFFYTPKADNFERNKGLKGFEGKQTNDGRNELPDNAFQRGQSIRNNHHPCVKPIDLMRYLVKLITPKHGICVDPFCGSGTTLIGCKLELIKYIGIDTNEEYCKIAEARVAAWNPEKYIEQTLF